MMTWALRALTWPHPGDRVLTAYLDGEAGRWVARAVAAHLRGCRRCRDKAAAHRVVLRTVERVANGISGEELAQMLAEGRARLLRSMGRPAELVGRVGHHDGAEAELILGCRKPAGYPPGTDITLDLIYAALLGDRMGAGPGRR